MRFSRRTVSFKQQIFIVFLVCAVLAIKGILSGEWKKSSYLLELAEPVEAYGITFVGSEASVRMGGRDFFGGFWLGDIDDENENSKVTFPLDPSTKSVSFYLGSIHYSEAYVDGCTFVTVMVDGEPVVSKQIFNHDLPTYHVVSVEDAEYITFFSDSEDIITAVGELCVREENYNENNHANSLDSRRSKLIGEIKPYYSSSAESLFCAYAENGYNVTVNEKVYEDAMEVYFPYVGKWESEAFAFFDLAGEYSWVSFGGEIGILDDYVYPFVNDGTDEMPLERDSEKTEILVTLLVYADDELVFREEITDFSSHNYRVLVLGCRKLCFRWEGSGENPPLKMVLSDIWAEK
jgi:hypothetical protein